MYVLAWKSGFPRRVEVKAGDLDIWCDILSY